MALALVSAKKPPPPRIHPTLCHTNRLLLILNKYVPFGVCVFLCAVARTLSSLSSPGANLCHLYELAPALAHSSFSLNVSSNDAVLLWSRLEAIDPAFAGIGSLHANRTLTAEDPALWALRSLYFWCLGGAEGGAGVPKEGAGGAGSGDGEEEGDEGGDGLPLPTAHLSGEEEGEHGAWDNDTKEAQELTIEVREEASVGRVKGGWRLLTAPVGIEQRAEVPGRGSACQLAACPCERQTARPTPGCALCIARCQDFWCRLHVICTLVDRPRQLRFVFTQLQLQDVTIGYRFGAVVHKKELIRMVEVMHGESGNAPRELEKMLSYVNLDEHDCVDFSAFTRLNMICRSLIRPLDQMRRLLRKHWLGERFWARQDKARGEFEAQKMTDLAALLASGFFAQGLFDHVAEEKKRRPVSLKARRAALRREHEREKEQARLAARPQTPVAPVGERTGSWWKEATVVRRKRQPLAPGQKPPEDERDGRNLVELDTASVLVAVKDAKRDAKAVLRKSKALWKDFTVRHSIHDD